MGAQSCGGQRGGAAVQWVHRVLDDRLNVDVDGHPGQQRRYDILEQWNARCGQFAGVQRHDELVLFGNRVVTGDELAVPAPLDVQLDPGQAVGHGGQVRLQGVRAVAVPLARTESPVPDDGRLRIEDHPPLPASAAAGPVSSASTPQSRLAVRPGDEPGRLPDDGALDGQCPSHGRERTICMPALYRKFRS
jgi:hypothetical protein